MIDIKGLDKAKVLQAKVLQALHGASRSQGMSVLHDRGAISYERAAELVAIYTNFDYVEGRVIKCDITGDEFEEWLFDRDNGVGAAESAIAGIRE